MMSSAAVPLNHSGHPESHSGIRRKLFAFPPESLFTFGPESCSSSPRNRFRDHPGILFVLHRNPQSWSTADFRRSDTDWKPERRAAGSAVVPISKTFMQEQEAIRCLQLQQQEADYQ
jgi:hypothetical protein